MALYARLHAMELGTQHPCGVDLFYPHDGKERWQMTINIDELSDFGLDDESIKEIKDGKTIDIEVRKVQ